MLNKKSIIRYISKNLYKNKPNHSKINDYIIDNIWKEIQQKEPPKLGPRSIFYHYVFDLKWEVDDAIRQIIEQFPSLDKEIVMKWLEEENQKSKIEKRKANNEGR